MRFIAQIFNSINQKKKRKKASVTEFWNALKTFIKTRYTLLYELFCLKKKMIILLSKMVNLKNPVYFFLPLHKQCDAAFATFLIWKILSYYSVLLHVKQIAKYENRSDITMIKLSSRLRIKRFHWRCRNYKILFLSC